MKKNKKERVILEEKFNLNYDNPNSICEGSFYIWNKAKNEICTHRENCPLFHKWKQVFLKIEYYELPRIQFYYVENFRRCKYKK